MGKNPAGTFTILQLKCVFLSNNSHIQSWASFGISKLQIVRPAIFFISFFVHSLQCTLNLLTQVNNNLYKYLRLAEIPVVKTEVPGVKTTAKAAQQH